MYLKNGSKSSNNTSVGLIVEGTGLRSVFAAGVLDCFMEKGMRFPYVIGTSTGISNIYGYAANQSGYAREHIIQYLLRDYYNNIKIGKKMTDDSKALVINEQAVLSSDINFEIVLTNCGSGEPEYFCEFVDEKQLRDLEKASYSMLALSKMVMLDGQYYMDGAISDALPIKHSIEKGNRKNVVILCTNRNHVYSMPTYQKILYERTYRKYPLFLETIMKQNHIYQKEWDFLLREVNSGNAFILKPEISEIKRLETDDEAVDDYYRHGYEIALQKWEELLQFYND